MSPPNRTSTHGPDSHGRIQDLLADRATQGLSSSELAELDALLAENPGIDPDAIDRTAAALDLAFSGEILGAGPNTMPSGLLDRLEAAALSAARKPATARASAGPLTEPPAPLPIANYPAAARHRGTSAWVAATGWIAAAACLTLAIWVWSVSGPRPVVPGPGGVQASATPAQRRDAFARSTPDAVTAPWSDFNSLSDQSPPEIRGVVGEVVWSESKQAGYLTFRGLPANDPGAEEYQLWIVDSRGLNQRVSGGVFSAATAQGGSGAKASAEVVIPIEPSLPIKGAAAFAVTIEPPGGNAVSDMSRRVVIASLPAKSPDLP